jgi:hypothetical protein
MKYVIAIGFSVFSFTAYPQIKEDKSDENYTIFHPTPKIRMREFSTDRPDVTESAYTVDAGHFQVETDLFKTERNSYNGIKSISNYFNAANCKLGITNSLDLQLVVTSFTSTKNIHVTSVLKQSGFGGLTLRAKQNLWGNDDGKTALSILPFINVPKGSEKFSGGIVFPFALSLSHGWDLGAQFETDWASSSSNNNYHFDYLASLTTSHSLCKDLDFFVETVFTRNNDIRLYEYFLNGGLIYGITKNINLDLGTYYGIKNLSSKTFFLGMSIRI